VLKVPVRIYDSPPETAIHLSRFTFPSHFMAFMSGCRHPTRRRMCNIPMLRLGVINPVDMEFKMRTRPRLNCCKNMHIKLQDDEELMDLCCFSVCVCVFIKTKAPLCNTNTGIV
jgi:hypothetical protein